MRAAGGRSTLTVNGEPRELEADVVTLLRRLGYGTDPQGIAVARNGAVVPRSRWRTEKLEAGDRVDIVGAVQGG